MYNCKRTLFAGIALISHCNRMQYTFVLMLSSTRMQPKGQMLVVLTGLLTSGRGTRLLAQCVSKVCADPYPFASSVTDIFGQCLPAHSAVRVTPPLA